MRLFMKRAAAARGDKRAKDLGFSAKYQPAGSKALGPCSSRRHSSLSLKSRG